MLSIFAAYELPQEGTISCPGDNRPRPPAQYDKACEFKLGQLEPCSAEKKFGYHEGKPCVMIKLNRVCARHFVKIKKKIMLQS